MTELSDNSYSIGLEAARQRFNEENARRESLDSKASLLLGFSGVIIGVVLSLFASRHFSEDTQGAAEYLVMISVVILLTSSFFALRAVWIVNYRSGPGDKALVHAVENLDPDALTRRLLHAYSVAFQNNWVQNQRKGSLLRVGFFSMAAGVLLSSISLGLLIMR